MPWDEAYDGCVGVGKCLVLTERQVSDVAVIRRHDLVKASTFEHLRTNLWIHRRWRLLECGSPVIFEDRREVAGDDFVGQ